MFDIDSEAGEGAKRYKILFFITLFILLGVTYYEIIQINKKETEVIFNTFEEITEIMVDVSGAINRPGAYKMSSDSRITDLIDVSGGISDDANVLWVDKHLNLSEILSDSQKIYIPYKWEEEGVVQSVGFVSNPNTTNVNTASLSELKLLDGVGDVYAQRIIDGRPYKNMEEFKTNSSLSIKLVEKINDQVSF